MGFIKEFKAFALGGNIIDLAVAVIIGATFSAVVASLAEHVITPLLLEPALDAAGVKNLEELTWGAVKFGKFLSAVINFIITALILFMIIKGVNKLKKKREEPAAAELTLQEQLLMEIRDSLKK